jgi:hypothetical protein
MASRGAGGTPGGVGEFVVGLALMGAGAYLFMDRVNVMSNLGSLFGGHAGLLLIPLGLGLGLLFFSARSIVGWLLLGGTLGTIFVCVLMNLTFFFMPTNFVRTAGMFGLMGIGFVMMVRSFRPGSRPEPEQ